MILRRNVEILWVINIFFLCDGQYVLRDNAKNSSGKDKSTYILVPKRDDQDFDKPVSSSSATGSEVVLEESGMTRRLKFNSLYKWHRCFC